MDVTKSIVTAKPDKLTLERAGKSRNTYTYRTPADHTVENVLSPDYFGKMMSSDLLTTYDMIEVLAEDGSHYFELMVRGQVMSAAQCITHLMNDTITIFGSDDEELPGSYEIEFVGGKDGHIIKLGTNTVEVGFMSRDLAVARIFALVAKDVATQQTKASIKSAADMNKPVQKKAPARKPAKKKEAA